MQGKVEFGDNSQKFDSVMDLLTKVLANAKAVFAIFVK